MGELTSTLGGRIVDSGLAASLITLLTALAMVTTRQPSRRRALARAGVLGAILAIPLVCLRPFEPFELVSAAGLGLQPVLIWIGDRLGTGDPSRWFLLFSRASFAIHYLPFVILCLYLLGVVIGLGRFALGWWGAGWIQRNSKAASPFAIDTYNSLPFAKGRPRPRLRLSARTRRPVLLGTFRETILIPPGMDSPESRDALRLSLLHELAHAQASDPWFGLVSELAAVLWFPLPPLWWIRRQMRLDQEYLADRQASAQFGAINRYAASLVDIAASPPSGSQPLDSGPVRRKPATALLPRVLMLIRAPFPLEGHPPTWWSASISVAAALLLLGATALTIHTSRAAPVPAPEIRTFAMASVILDGSPMSVAETALPVRLPADFHFTLSVHATKSELAQISVLGMPLAPERLVETSFLPEERSWHKLRLDRAGRKLTLAVDNVKPTTQLGDSLVESLTIHSLTRRPTTFRSLVLTW